MAGKFDRYIVNGKQEPSFLSRLAKTVADPVTKYIPSEEERTENLMRFLAQHPKFERAFETTLTSVPARAGMAVIKAFLPEQRKKKVEEFYKATEAIKRTRPTRETLPLDIAVNLPFYAQFGKWLEAPAERLVGQVLPKGAGVVPKIVRTLTRPLAGEAVSSAVVYGPTETALTGRPLKETVPEETVGGLTGRAMFGLPFMAVLAGMKMKDVDLKGLTKAQKEAVRLLQKGTSARELSKKGISIGDIQVASQKLRGLDVLAEIDKAVNAGETKKAKELAEKVMRAPKTSPLAQYKENRIIKELAGKAVEGVTKIPKELEPLAQEAPRGIAAKMAKSWGAEVIGDKAILYHGTNNPNVTIKNLHEGSFLSSVAEGKDITGNEGAAAYGKFVKRFEIPLKDLDVSSTGEFRFVGKTTQFKGGKFPEQFYREYNAYFGSNMTKAQIEAQTDILDVARAISGYDEVKVKQLVGADFYNQAVKEVSRIPKELEPLAQEARKYKSAEEFVKDNLLFAWIKSHLPYKDIRSLADVSKNDLRIFTKDFNKEIKKSGIEDVGRQIRNAANYSKIDIPDLFTRKSQLTDFYNQVVSGVTKEAPTIKTIPKELEPLRVFRSSRREGLKAGDFVTKTKRGALAYERAFGGGLAQGEVRPLQEFYLDRSSKILKYEDLPSKLKPQPYGELSFEDMGRMGGVGKMFERMKVYAKNKGFDVVETGPGEMAILNLNIIKTKSQLTDFYNQAVYGVTKEAPTIKTIPKPTTEEIVAEVGYKRGDIAEIERKIDDLIGYTPDTTIKWWQDRQIRDMLLEETKQVAPREVISQINNLQKQLAKVYELKDKQDVLKRQIEEKKLRPLKQAQLEREVTKLNTGIDLALKHSSKILEGMGTGKRFPGVPPEGARPGEPIEFAEKVPFEETGGRRIGETFQKEMGVPLSVNKRLKVYAGRFRSTKEGGKMLTGEIQVKNLDDLKTVSHETGHYLDISLGQAYSGTKGDRGILSYNKPLRKELIKVTEELTGKIPERPKSQKAYRRSRKELIAEYVMAQERFPDRARELAPNFSEIFDRSYREDETVRYVVDKLTEWNKAFQPLIDYVESLRKIPEIRRSKTLFSEPGNFAQNFWREKVGNKLWGLYERGVENIGKTRLGRYFVESRGLPKNVETILDSRSRLIAGQRMRVQQEIVDPLSILTKEESEDVAKLVQKFEKADSRFTGLAEETKRELAVWGKEARKVGLLDEEAFWNNVGQYFPYFYSTKEFAENKKKFGFINYKKLRADLSGYKRRLTDEEMGVKALENKFGTWPSAREKIDAISKEEKVRLGREVREQMGLIRTVAYPVKRRLDQMIQSVYTTKALNAIADIPGLTSPKQIEGWHKLPDSKQLGNLANQYVPERLYDEVMAMTESQSGIGQLIGNINSVWKTTRVPMNPATVSRNIQTNTITAWLGDTPLYDPRVVKKGVDTFINHTDVYKQLRDYGLYSGTYSRTELQQLAYAAKEGKTDKIIEWALKAYDMPRKAYGAIEDVYKTIMAQYAIDKGATTDEAIDYANKWLFDYSKVSRVVEVARQGMLPFVTWSAKMFPRLLETAIRKPEKFIILAALIKGVDAIARREVGVTEFEEERNKPWWLQERGTMTTLLPWRDTNGQLQYLDLSYVMPWGSWTQTGKSGLPQAIEPSNPFTILYNAYIANYDPFFRRVIAPEYATPLEQQKEKAKYVGRGFIPSLLPGGYGFEQVSKSFVGEGDYYGRVKTPKTALARTIFGVKIEPGGEVEYLRKVNQLVGQIRDIEGDISLTLRHQGLSREAKQKKVKQLINNLLQKQEEILELVQPELRETNGGKALKGILAPFISREETTQDNQFEKYIQGESENPFSRYIR